MSYIWSTQYTGAYGHTVPLLGQEDGKSLHPSVRFDRPCRVLRRETHMSLRLATEHEKE